MEHWGARFREIREKKNLSQYDVARALEKDTTQISRYERGSGAKTITKSLERILKEVFTLEEIEYIKNGEVNTAGVVEESTPAYGLADDKIEIPYYSEVYASAGGGSDATNMQMVSPISISKEMLSVEMGVQHAKGLTIINASGDSMKPTIKSGDKMLVYPLEYENFQDGSIYVIMCGSSLLVKRVWFNPVTKVYTLASDNVEVKNIELTLDEQSDCRFVGRVVGCLATF